MSLDHSQSQPEDDMKVVLDRVVELFYNPYTTASTPPLEPKEISRMDAVPRHTPEMGFSESMSMAAEVFALTPSGDVKPLSSPESVISSMPYVPSRLRPGYHDPKEASISAAPRCPPTYDYFFTAPSCIPQPNRSIIEVEWSYQETARMLSATLALERLHDLAHAELVSTGWTEECDPRNQRRSSLQLNPPGLDGDEDLVPNLLGEDWLFAITSLQNGDASSLMTELAPTRPTSSQLSPSFMHSAIPPPSSDTVASDVRPLYASVPQNEVHCTPTVFPTLPSPFALHRGTSTTSIPRTVTFTDDSLVPSSSNTASVSGSGLGSKTISRLRRSRSTSAPSRSTSPFSLLSPARSILRRRMRSPELSTMPEVLQDPFDSEFKCRDFSLQSLVTPSPGMSGRPTSPSTSFAALHRPQSPGSPGSLQTLESGGLSSPTTSPASPILPVTPVTPPVTSFAAAAAGEVPLRVSRSPEPVVELPTSVPCSPHASRPATPLIPSTELTSPTDPLSSENRTHRKLRTLVRRVLSGNGNAQPNSSPGGRLAESRFNAAPAHVTVSGPRLPSSGSALASRAASLPNARVHAHAAGVINNGNDTVARSITVASQTHPSGPGATGKWGAVVRRASTRSTRSTFNVRARPKRSWTESRVPVAEAEQSHSSSDEVDADGCDARTTTSTVATSVATQEREKEKSWVLASASPPTSPERQSEREMQQQGKRVGLGIAMGMGMGAGRTGRTRERPAREVSPAANGTNGTGHTKGSRWSGLWH